jgi:hypothetical protein
LLDLPQAPAGRCLAGLNRHSKHGALGSAIAPTENQGSPASCTRVGHYDEQSKPLPNHCWRYPIASHHAACSAGSNSFPSGPQSLTNIERRSWSQYLDFSSPLTGSL